MTNLPRRNALTRLPTTVSRSQTNRILSNYRFDQPTGRRFQQGPNFASRKLSVNGKRYRNRRLVITIILFGVHRMRNRSPIRSRSILRVRINLRRSNRFTPVQGNRNKIRRGRNPLFFNCARLKCFVSSTLQHITTPRRSSVRPVMMNTTTGSNGKVIRPKQVLFRLRAMANAVLFNPTSLSVNSIPVSRTLWRKLRQFTKNTKFDQPNFSRIRTILFLTI